MVDEYLSTKLTECIETLPLTSRASNILKRNGVGTIAELLSLQQNDLLGMKGIGPTTMTEVKSVMQAHILPLVEKYSRGEIGKAVREIRDTRSTSAQVTFVPTNQLAVSLDDSLEILPLSLRARNALIRGGIKTIADLINASEIEIKNTRHVGAQTFEEIQAIRKEIRFSSGQIVHNENHLKPSEFEPQTSLKTTFLPLSHLLVKQISQIGDDSSVLSNLNAEVLKQLNKADIHIDKDLLQSRMYQCAKMKEIAVEDWETVFNEFKSVYHRVIQQVQQLPIEGKPPYEIEQLGLNKRTANRLLFAGITDLQQLIQLTFADIIVIKGFGPLALVELLTVLRGKSNKVSNEVNLILSIKESELSKPSINLSDATIDKLVIFGINDLTDLEQYTVEDLVINAQLTYQEAQQVDEFLATTDKALSKRWPEHALVRSSDYQFLKKAGIPLDRIGVSRLALPINLEGQLKSLKIETVDTVAVQSGVVLKAVLGRYGEKYVDILTKNLKTYFAWLPAQSNWDDEIEVLGISPLYFIWLKETTLEKVIDNLLNHVSYERSRQVIRLRFGLDGGGQRTLQQVGDQLGLTRERIRQIEKRSLEKLKKGISVGLIRALHIAIEKEIKTQGGLMSLAQIGECVAELTEIGEIDLDSVVSLLLSLQPDQFVQVKKNKRWGLKEAPLNLVQPVSKQLVQILQAVSAPLPQVDLIERLIQSKLYSEDKIQHLVSTRFIMACLSTDDRFEEIEGNQWGLTRWRKRRTDEIVMALRKLSKPSHFTEIAKVANEMLPPSQRASTRVYHAQLGNKPHLFAWVGPGTFGLVEWGLTRARFYVDIAEELLQKRGKPLTFEEIFPVINAEREASPSSIIFMLGTNRRFRQYPDNRYGLTSWDEEENSGNDDEDNSFLDDLKQQLFDDFFDD